MNNTAVCGQTIGQVLAGMVALLRQAGVDSPQTDAEWLLAQACGCPRLQLRLNRGQPCPQPAAQQAAQWATARARRVPLQYILGSAPFGQLTLYTAPGVLIPREDSMSVVRAACDHLQAGAPAEVLDLCCGSGCIGLAVAQACPQVTLTLADLSALACQLAKRNAAVLGLTQRCRVVQGDGFCALAGQRFGVITCNPPYIPTGQIEGLAPEIARHEPRLALDGGADGLDFYRMLAARAADHLLPGGRLCIEIADQQADATTAVFTQAGWRYLQTWPDEAGNPRCLVFAPGDPAAN